jgi:hypothetical protein
VAPDFQSGVFLSGSRQLDVVPFSDEKHLLGTPILIESDAAYTRKSSAMLIECFCTFHSSINAFVGLTVCENEVQHLNAQKNLEAHMEEPTAWLSAFN